MVAVIAFMAFFGILVVAENSQTAHQGDGRIEASYSGHNTPLPLHPGAYTHGHSRNQSHAHHWENHMDGDSNQWIPPGRFNANGPIEWHAEARNTETGNVHKAGAAVIALPAEHTPESSAETHETSAEIEAPRLYEIPMGVPTGEMQRRIDCAQGEVTSCVGIRTRTLP